MSGNIVKGQIVAKLRSPLSVARGLGSASGGFEHWWTQRMTSLLLVPLCLWFVFSVASLAGMSYGGVQIWMGSTFNAMMMILFVTVGFQHASAGVGVVLEDYVHDETAKMICLLGQRLFFLVLGLACIISVLKVAL